MRTKWCTGTERAYRGPFLDRNVAAEGCGIGQNHVVANHAIMRDVGVSHNQDVAAHAGQSAALNGAAVDGNELANLVVVANFQARGFASVGQILRCHPDRAKREEAVVGANLGGPLDGHVRNQMATFSQLDVCPDHAIGADLAEG